MYSQIEEQKNEAALRLRYDAANGPGSAEKAYAAEVARRISVTEKAALVSGMGFTTARAIEKLREKGLDAGQKTSLLHVLSIRTAAAALSAPLPTASAPRPTPASLPAPSFTPPPAAATVAPTVPISAYPLTDELNAISDAIDKTRFYREHKANLDSEHRRQCRDLEAVRPSKVPVATGDIISRLASIGDPASRVAFYRANKTAIDAEYSRLSQKQ